MSQTLYVGGLSYGTTEDSLKAYLGQAGNVISVKIVTDHNTGKSRGFGFAEMEDEDAQRAIDMFNGQDFEDRTLTINLARPKSDRPRRTSNFSNSNNRRRNSY